GAIRLRRGRGTGKSGYRRAISGPVPPAPGWPSLLPAGPRRVEGDSGDDLVGDLLREALQRGLLGGDGGIFGADHVDPRVRAGGGVEQHGALAGVDELVAGAQGPALAGHRIVGADAVAGNVVVEANHQPVAGRAVGGGAEPVLERGPDQPARPAADRRHLDRMKRLRHRARAAAAVKRVEAAARDEKGEGEERGGGRPHATTFTSRSGTTMTWRGGFPSRMRATLSEASAIASSASLPVPLGAERVSRSLPLTWTAMVTWSSTRRAGSAAGHSASAISPSRPIAAQSCSARCGTIGATSRTRVSTALLREGDGAAFSIA